MFGFSFRHLESIPSLDRKNVDCIGVVITTPQTEQVPSKTGETIDVTKFQIADPTNHSILVSVWTDKVPFK